MLCMADYAYYILMAIPFFLVSMLAEWLLGKKHKKELYNFEDAITNLNIGIGSQAIGLFVKIVIVGVYTFVYKNFALIKIENTLVAFLFGSLIFDFIFYWAHRWGHEINFFWGAHIVHHQSQEYNLSVALRQSWFHNLISFWMFLPLPILGIDPIVFVSISAFSILYQYWIHTKTIGKLGPLEWVLNTPSAHRVHHATNPDYLDKNYGAVLIIWDRLFGTYQEELEEPTYGITTPLKSWNPVWANLHFYKELLQGLSQTKGLANKIKLVFWQGPDNLGKILKSEKQPKDARVYRTYPSAQTIVYVFVQFTLLTAGLVKYMMHFDELSNLYRGSFLGLMIWTMWACGALMGKNKWVKFLEIPRVIITVLSLNLLYYFQYFDWFLILSLGSAIFSLFTLGWLLKNWNLLQPNPIPQKVNSQS